MCGKLLSVSSVIYVVMLVGRIVNAMLTVIRSGIYCNRSIFSTLGTKRDIIIIDCIWLKWWHIWDFRLESFCGEASILLGCSIMKILAPK